MEKKQWGQLSETAAVSAICININYKCPVRVCPECWNLHRAAFVPVACLVLGKKMRECFFFGAANVEDGVFDFFCSSFVFGGKLKIEGWFTGEQTRRRNHKSPNIDELL